MGLTKVDAWLRGIIVDPLDKSPLLDAPGEMISMYGRRYPVVNGVCDLRLLSRTSGALAEIWRHGQEEYEEWACHLSDADARQDYTSEREGVREVYEAVPIIGRCLDVGGHQGRLREFLTPDQEYVSLDPYVEVFLKLESQPNLLAAFPRLHEPVNFIHALAEHLPFQRESFDTVHMRSVIDHFLDPELALCEARRVLRPGGQLVVGLYVEGGRTGRSSMSRQVKDVVKGVLSIFVEKYRDHHVWHPTYAELVSQIELCGFKVQKTHWQKSCESVCYIKAVPR